MAQLLDMAMRDDWHGPGEGWAIDRRPGILVVAPPVDRDEGAAMASGAGFRIIASFAPVEASHRLPDIIGADALLVDLRMMQPDDPRLANLLTALLAWPGWRDARVLMLVDLGTVEAVAAATHLPFDRLLCEASMSDIGLALCLLAREDAATAVLHDMSRESDAARLEALSEEVRRLAQTIDRLARDGRSDPASALRETAPEYARSPTSETPRRSRGDGRGGTVPMRGDIRTLIQLRRMRDRFLPGDLFADPAWDMILDLMGARLDGKRVSVSSLCIAAAVPPTTALRWIAQLTERGICERRNDPDDARRVFISLSDEAADGLSRWFAATRQAGVRFT
ncbi:MAG: hypothetical protein ABW192_07830, partial [Sphingobium sp.]